MSRPTRVQSASATTLLAIAGAFVGAGLYAATAPAGGHTIATASAQTSLVCADTMGWQSAPAGCK